MYVEYREHVLLDLRSPAPAEHVVAVVFPASQFKVRLVLDKEEPHGYEPGAVRHTCIMFCTDHDGLQPVPNNLEDHWLVHGNPCVTDSLHALPRDDGDVHGRNVPDRPLHAAGRRIRLRQENSDEPGRDDLIVLP